MTKPVFVSLARRFATMAALLAGIAMLAIAGASWWLINQEHAASLRSLLEKDAELQATSVSSKLHALAAQMSNLAKSSLVANTLRDSTGQERFLIPYLNGIQRIQDIPVAILLTDFEGREIARNGNASFSEQELRWLREKLRDAQPAARVQLGEDGKGGEELIAVEFIIFSHSNSAEGALLYRIKLDELALQDGVRLVRDKEAELLLHSQAAIAAAVNVPPIYKHLDFAVLTSADPSARSVDWQRLGLFFILAVGLVLTVIMLGLHFGKRLTRDLRGLEFFARDIAEKGFGTGRAEVADSLEVASLAQSINGMLEHLQQEHDKLNESEERWKFALEGAGDGMWDWNPQTDKAVFSKRWKEILGYAENEFSDTGAAWIEHLHPDDKDRVLTVVQEYFASDRPLYAVEFRMRCKDGSWKWIMSRGKLISRDGDGNPLRLIGTHTDISERKRAQNDILRLNASLEERVQERTEELQSQQEELRQSNEELAEKNQLLADQKLQVEHKNRQIEAAQLTLQEKAEQLTLTSQYKSEFLSSMSHELRTPLNSLLILSQLLAENPERNLSERQVEYAQTIQGAGQDLLALISDILDLSKIESGNVTLELDDVSLANISEQLERSFRHVAESRGLGFGVELAPSLPPSLHTDAQRLQQVLKNLLSNAFKFTSKGQVSVRIAPVESGWSVDHAGLNRAQAVIGFYVTDSGIGLEADKQQIIFEAFQQADTGTAKKYGGTGLGLSISRELAWLLGGELHLVASEPGQGSTFALYLPLEFLGSEPNGTTLSALAMTNASVIASAARQSTMDRHGLRPGDDETGLLGSDPNNSSLTGKKVLLVDDDVRNIFALTAVLERHKMVVTSAENGLIALEELVQNPDVDIVLMDLMMPEMDGYEAMRQIRQMKPFESLPIIALTAKAMQGDREKCIAAGASDYLSKPVDTDQLLSLLRVWLYR